MGEEEGGGLRVVRGCGATEKRARRGRKSGGNWVGGTRVGGPVGFRSWRALGSGGRVDERGCGGGERESARERVKERERKLEYVLISQVSQHTASA